jgi:hypothetical protein
VFAGARHAWALLLAAFTDRMREGLLQANMIDQTPSKKGPKLPPLLFYPLLHIGIVKVFLSDYSRHF